MLFRKVPAARPHEQYRGLGAQFVRLAFGADVIDLAPDRVAQVEMTLNVVVPFWGVGVLEIRHEHAGAGVERVDDHLAVDRPGDLDAPVLDVGKNAGARPVALANRTRLRQEIRQFPGIELLLSGGAQRKQLRAARAELALQSYGECDRLRRQDLGIFGSDAAADFDAGAVSWGAH